MKKAKSRKTIRGYRPKFSITKNLIFSGQKKLADILEKKAKSRKTIRSYRPKFSITKKLTFSGQKKLADIPEKITNRLVKTLKRIVPLKY